MGRLFSTGWGIVHFKNAYMSNDRAFWSWKHDFVDSFQNFSWLHDVTWSPRPICTYTYVHRLRTYTWAQMLTSAVPRTPGSTHQPRMPKNGVCGRNEFGRRNRTNWSTPRGPRSASSTLRPDWVTCTRHATGYCLCGGGRLQTYRIQIGATVELEWKNPEYGEAGII